MPTDAQDNQLKLPPIGNSEQAEKYLQQILQLLEADKIKVSHTDLGKFELASVQDHYRVDLQDYEVEISHSKQPDTSADFYVLIFNNIRKIQNNEASCSEKVILAYIHLTANQFQNFKNIADEWLEKKRKEEEARRFKEAMDPVDHILSELTSGQGEFQTEESKIAESEPLVVENQEESNNSDSGLSLAEGTDQKSHEESDKEEKSDYLFSTYPPYPPNSSF